MTLVDSRLIKAIA